MHFRQAVQLNGANAEAIVGLVKSKQELALWDDWDWLLYSVMEFVTEGMQRGLPSPIQPILSLYLPMTPDELHYIANSYATGILQTRGANQPLRSKADIGIKTGQISH